MSTATGSETGRGTATTSAWISATLVSSLLGISNARVRQLARDGTVRTLDVPGGFRRYHLADVLKLAEGSPQPAG